MFKKGSVIIITGPCGVGKTTITNIIADKLNLKLIRGDDIKQKLFPQIADITMFPEKLKIVKKEIFERSREYVKSGKSVVIDYVILGKTYIEKYQEEYKDRLIFRVLLPERAIIYQRDEARECWSSGKDCIDDLYRKYTELVSIIGAENYIDNANEIPEQTFKKLLLSIPLPLVYDG